MENNKVSKERLILISIIGGLILIGFATFLFLNWSGDKKEDEVLTGERLDRYGEGLDIGFDVYQSFIEEYPAKRVASGTYSVKTKSNILSIDPLYEDEYSGYRFNEDTNYVIYDIEDGYYIFVYESDQEKQKVLSRNFWPSKDISLELTIFDLKSQKSELIDSYYNTSKPEQQQEIRESISIVNSKLMKKNQEILETQIPG